MTSPADERPLLLAATAALGVAGAAWVASGSDILDRAPARSGVLQPIPIERAASRRPKPARSTPGGRFRPARAPTEAEQLLAIGYLSGSREATGEVSVTVHDPDRAWQGLNLYTSGHAAEAVLMDMDGHPIHTWARSFDEVWPDWSGPRNENMTFWRRVALLDDGGLLAIFEGTGLVRLDADSHVVWARPNNAHHDLEVLDNGEILVLSRRVEMAEELNIDGPTLVDYVYRLGPDGLVRNSVSLLNAYFRSPFHRHFMPGAQRGGDSFHTNTLHRIRHTHGPFQEGHLLLSMRHLSTVAVLDPVAGVIRWSQQGPWKFQHDPKFLDNGNMLVFDNGPPERAASRVLELDWRSGEVVWSYEGTPDAPFFSATCGTAQRLPNGNTLITESDAGRAFEVTADGEIVWEFHNPHRPDNRPGMVATLFEVIRLPPDTDLSWLPEQAGGDDDGAPR